MDPTAQPCGCALPGDDSSQSCSWEKFRQRLPKSDPCASPDYDGDMLHRGWTGGRHCECRCHDAQQDREVEKVDGTPAGGPAEKPPAWGGMGVSSRGLERDLAPRPAG